ncbi:hypothetical protein MOMOMIXON_6 [Mycobacterium phage MoMoMixon]|uniref:Uncharacterized protein n=4 Tax=Bixzunavirus TaxID=680114 RepID=B5LKB7_9CAUD|nr:gp7 [Mycobacterium phage Spud]YP_009017342.1 hypothetical protein MOMOMIXON_6 [Mycobacterium phage MoMoMixon]YP_010058564.1 hypothetical protein KHO65_gp005 [Mycobacterium phage Sauce]AER49522.1 hypothetical protein PIO_7 [Mycobacterium phage Pio]QAY12566.1 hypothetical protein SEA_NIDHOGG_6 [Mycobacterium phage Nidhogg]ACH62464.1 hypothetical protein SPUD_7 [Mycobacterium phage Spud]AER25606.1 hypothetical protein MOMOMIXON_6 [Mycobacterium phage MoMoMixon]AYR01276.1 hypothetical protein
MSDKPEPGDKVRILVGGPHENLGQIATVSNVYEDGQVVVYLGDQDEDEWVYSPHELENVTNETVTVRVEDLRHLLRHGVDWSDDHGPTVRLADAVNATVRGAHLHVAPRRPGDGLTLPWTGQKNPEGEDK